MALWSLIASILEPCTSAFPWIYYILRKIAQIAISQKRHFRSQFQNSENTFQYKLPINRYLVLFPQKSCSQCLKQRWSVQARVYAAHIFQSEVYLLLSLNVIKLQQLEHTISHLRGWMRLTSIKSGEGWTEWLTSAGSAGWGRRVLILTTSFPSDVKYHELQSPLYVIKHLGRLQNFCVLLQLAQ